MKMISRPKFKEIKSTVNFETSKKCTECKKVKDIFEFDVYEGDMPCMVRIAMPFMYYSKCRECSVEVKK